MAFFAGFIYRQFIHYPPVPTESFKGKTVIVTGSNVGLGLEACRWMVNLGASKIILACRNVDKGKTAAEDIQATTSCSPDTLEVWHLDMSSYASVEAFAKKAKAELPRLDVLLANAGVSTTTFRLTEGNEETITTNVISLTLLALLLLPKLRDTAEQHKTQTHLTVIASELHEVAWFKEREAPPGQLFATLRDQSKSHMRDRYNVSKLLEVLIVKQLAALHPLSSTNVIINCVAPGFCHSGLTRDYDSLPARLAKRLLCRPTEVGARTLVYGASAGAASHGQYLPDCVITPAGGLGAGEEGEKLQRRVWEELGVVLEGVKKGVTTVG